MFIDLINEDIKKQDLSKNYFLDNGKDLPDTWTWSENDLGIFFFEKSTNKRRYSFIQNCEYCKREFCVRKTEQMNIRACSRFCSAKLSQAVRKELTCAWCEESIKRSESRLRKSITGCYFCNRKCKEQAQQIGGLKNIQPPHYKDGMSSYSDRAFRFYGAKCVDCNLTFKPLLVAHHIDGNRENADIKNLEVLCVTHHLVRHMFFSEKQKSWIMNYKKLTPRDKIQEINKLIKNN